MRRIRWIALALSVLGAATGSACDWEFGDDPADDTVPDDDSPSSDDDFGGADDTTPDGVDDDTGDDTADDSGDDDTGPDCVWSVETIDGLSEATQYPAIAMGPGDELMVAYVNARRDLLLATRSATGWIPEVVDAIDGYDAPALAIDGGGEPHIATWGLGQDDLVMSLRHWHRDAGAWNQDHLATWLEGTDVPAIVVDPQGAVHIAAGVCASSLSSFAYVLTNAFGPWSAEWGSSWPQMCPGVSMVLDAAGLPWVAFSEAVYMFPPSRLVVAHSEGLPAFWPWSIAAADVVGTHFSLAMGPADRAAVAFDPGGSSPLAVAVLESGVWQTTDVPLAATIQSGRALGVDAVGRMHLVVRDNDAEQLVYATDRAGAWVYGTIPAPGRPAYGNLVVDPQTHPHVAFVDMNAGTIHHAECVFE